MSYDKKTANDLYIKMFKVIEDAGRGPDNKILYDPANVLTALQTLVGVCLALAINSNPNVDGTEIAKSFFDGTVKIMGMTIESGKLPEPISVEDVKKCLN